MEKMVLWVCIFVGFLGLSSAILGFAAEARGIKAHDVRVSDGRCIYPESPSLGLGLAAAVVLLLDQILISSFAGCICCKKVRPSGMKFCIGVTLYVVSWVTFALAFILLGSAAILSTSRTEDIEDYRGCHVVKRGIFAGGAVLSFVTVSLGIIYYVIASSAKPPEAQVYNYGIAMGQPQMTTPPAFVHEDTYRRQQCP